MTRKVFYSFHFDGDSQRAAKIRNIGKVEDNVVAIGNAWESVRKKTDEAISSWIDAQFEGKSCCVVLIGKETAGRKWIKYEIRKAWNLGKGLLGIYIHNLTDLSGARTLKGSNPFNAFNVNGMAMSSLVKTYDPPGLTSAEVYAHIANNLERWIEAAIAARTK